MTTTTILITRTVKFRGGRSFNRGMVLPANVVEGGFTVPHPSGIQGAFAMVPAANAVEVR